MGFYYFVLKIVIFLFIFVAPGVEITGDKAVNRNQIGTGQDPEVFTPSKGNQLRNTSNLFITLSVYYLLTIYLRYNA